MDFGRLTAKAKDLISKRGGTQSVKEDAMELRDIATGPGSMKDKAKNAADAIREPGAAQESPATPPPETPPASGDQPRS